MTAKNARSPIACTAIPGRIERASRAIAARKMSDRKCQPPVCESEALRRAMAGRDHDGDDDHRRPAADRLLQPRQHVSAQTQLLGHCADKAGHPDDTYDRQERVTAVVRGGISRHADELTEHKPECDKGAKTKEAGHDPQTHYPAPDRIRPTITTACGTGALRPPFATEVALNHPDDGPPPPRRPGDRRSRLIPPAIASPRVRNDSTAFSPCRRSRCPRRQPVRIAFEPCRIRQPAANTRFDQPVERASDGPRDRR